jgi:glutathione S-transferase
MMKLRSSPPSPFGRKVKIAAHHLGLADRIEIVVADTTDPSDDLRRQNPLGKIPCLVLGDGSSIYDSRVILEYLDLLAGGGRIIPPGFARLDALTRQALADGIMDAALLQVYEVRYRPEEHRLASWTDMQAGKVERALAFAEEHCRELGGELGRELGEIGGEIDVGDIALACALGYLDLRFAGTWRASRPRLTAWLDAFAAHVPSFEATRMKG